MDSKKHQQTPIKEEDNEEEDEDDANGDYDKD